MGEIDQLSTNTFKIKYLASTSIYLFNVGPLVPLTICDMKCCIFGV